MSARALSREAARREKRGRQPEKKTEESRASPVSSLQSLAWSFACLGHFALRTKKKERLLVLYLPFFF